MSLGSWRTYDRIGHDSNVAVLQAARTAGINFLEVARYDDETGTAPIRTGFSEVAFGEAFRASGWPRDEVIVAEKLWWEFWPAQDAVQELEASLGRTGLDRVDFIYSDPPPDALPMDEVTAQIGHLITAGKARAWGIVNWSSTLLNAATRSTQRHGAPCPAAAQFAYSLVHRSPVEDQEMIDALRTCGASVVASYALLGGVLSGKYAGSARGRMAGQLGDPRLEPAVAASATLAALATELGVTQAALAYAFALANPLTATVLFGATASSQIAQNVRALDVLEALSPGHLAELRSIGDSGHIPVA